MKPIRKVLVVDDSQLMHSLYESLLPDMEVVHAYDGAEALEQLPRHPDTDLILLDLKMPTMNGLTFLHASRRNPAIVKIPIIIVTSASERGDVARALSTGAKGFLNKPFRRAELTQVIDHVLEGEGSLPEPPGAHPVRL